MFIIQDWAGNVLFNGREFESFEDAWDFIYEQFPDEENFEDYYVTQGKVREARYLDPNDPRARLKQANGQD